MINFKIKFGLFKLDKNLVQIEVKVAIPKGKISSLYSKFNSILVKKGIDPRSLNKRELSNVFKLFVNYYVLVKSEEFKISRVVSVKCSPKLEIDCSKVKKLINEVKSRNLFDFIYELRYRLSKKHKVRLAYDINLERKIEMELKSRIKKLQGG